MVLDTDQVPDFTDMTTREVLVRVATNQHHMAHDIVEIKVEAKRQNGTLKDLILKAARQDGAMWALGILMTVGITTAGVVVALVTLGG